MCLYHFVLQQWLTVPSWVLAGVVQLIRVLSWKHKVVSLILSQGTYLGCRFDPPSEFRCVLPLAWTHMIPGPGANPSLGMYRMEAYWCFSLASMFLSLPSSLEAMKKVSSGEDKKLKIKTEFLVVYILGSIWYHQCSGFWAF